MSIREKSEAPAQAKVESTGHEAAAGGEKPRTLEHEDLESSPLAGQTAAAEPGDQLSFIPPGWISLDLRGNRLVIFLRNYPFEEKFSGIREEFERRRYEERKREALLRQRRREAQLPHFAFGDPSGEEAPVEVGERQSAAGRKAFDFFGLAKAFFACLLKGSRR